MPTSVAVLALWNYEGSPRCFRAPWTSTYSTSTSSVTVMPKTHALLLEEKPYGNGHDVEKVVCVGHVQKRMGTALCELKKQYRGQKL